MTTPKEALERLRDYLRGEAKKTDTCYTCYTDQAAFIATRLSTILASLQGEDAVERVARIIDPDGFCPEPNPDESKLVRAARRHLACEKARAILATGLVPDEAAVRTDNTANLISIIADIREKTGLGGKPMLIELADAIVAEMDRRVADEREKCAEARAEIDRLNAQVEEALRSCLAEREGRLKAEAAISTLRARVREVVGPFSRLDISHTDDIDDSALVFENEGGNIVLGHLRAARQLNEDLK